MRFDGFEIGVSKKAVELIITNRKNAWRLAFPVRYLIQSLAVEYLGFVRQCACCWTYSRSTKQMLPGKVTFVVEVDSTVELITGS